MNMIKMVHFIPTMLVLGIYLVYVCSFHTALPGHHGVLKKSLISHSVLAALIFLLLFVIK